MVFGQSLTLGDARSFYVLEVFARSRLSSLS